MCSRLFVSLRAFEDSRDVEVQTALQGDSGMKELIRNMVRDALTRLSEADPSFFSQTKAHNIEISRTKEERFGDYSTNAALVLSRSLGIKPRDLALRIGENLIQDSDVLSRYEIAGPGFINFFLAPATWRRNLDTIHSQKEAYGCSPPKEAPRILLEFVSANPTGPLHVGHGRGAAVGDSLARLLRFCGYNVETEYYVNDSGNQMKILGRSLILRCRELIGDSIVFPEDHYRGDYMLDLARESLATGLGSRFAQSPEEDVLKEASAYAGDRILAGIEQDLNDFGVTYDRYFRESQLHRTGAISKTLDQLRLKGKTELHDGAVWFSMDDQADEKDRVLVRASGEPTYFAADAAYHLDKLQRGYQRLVDIWGSDHHGYVPRVRAAVEALGYSPEALQVLLVQFVNLIKDGRKISMSTRSGEFITLREVLEEVGSDAARFFFLTKKCDSHLDFDLDLAKKQSRDNPVYYVQYAHARVSAIFRIASERGIDTDMTDPDLNQLALPEEKRIMKHLADFPDMLLEAAETLEPHRITFYLMSLAELFHSYYHDNRVLTEDACTKKARLFLVEAVRQVLANGLTILGVTAPHRM